MSCPISLNGITLGCKDNVGGVKVVYIADRNDIASLPVVSGTPEKISAITMVATKKFKTYNFKKQTASGVTTPTVTDASDNIFFTTDLVLKFNKLDSAKRLEIMSLATGQLAVIFEDNNGKYWYMGYDNEVSMSAGSAMTGTAYGDANGYEITLQDISRELPYEVDATIIAGIIA